MNATTLSLKEKLHLFSGDGNPFVKIFKAATMMGYASNPFGAGKMGKHNYPGLQFADGPRGVVLGASTCFPVTMARGASWDVELENKVGQAVGLELRAQGANTWGGVCINLVRHPAWGRAQESYGEDPVVLGKMGAAVTRGVQEYAIACVKHFAVNSIEVARFKVNVKIDERVLHEIYLPHFKMCVDADAGIIMSAYNKMNGDYCGENHHLLTEILKEQWGFKGFVISDWVLGVRKGIKGFNAGLDVEMPACWRFQMLPLGLKFGKIKRERVDDAANRIVNTLLKFEKNKKSSYPPLQELYKQHNELALDVAHKSIVLLKNESVNGQALLPLKDVGSKKIAVIGELAKNINIGDMGSSRVRPKHVVTIYEGIKQGAGENNIIYDDGKSLELADVAAKSADTVVLVVGYKHNDEGEYIPPQGGDRKSLRLSAKHEELINAVVGANPNTIVVMIGGSAIVTPWSNKVPALVMAWYPGQQGGTALWNILSGKVNPSAKLPVAFPADEKHTPFFDRNAKEIVYDFYHGYRYLDKHHLKPNFYFGFGLSYTTFDFYAPQFTWNADEQKGFIELDVKNTGERDGATVVQLYARYDASLPIERPAFELKDFVKTELRKGETKKIKIDVNARMFAYYQPQSKDWHTLKGNYTFYIGSSSSMDDLQEIPCAVLNNQTFIQ
jgi:beta-glucosidase